MADTDPIKVGTEAPDFTLPDQDKSDWTLSSFRGKKTVALCFYPLDWSPVCESENQCLSADLQKFSEKGTEVVGISCDSFFSHKAWANAQGFKHTLLADMHRNVCKQYGLYFPDLNCAQRATVLVDSQGKVSFVKVQPIKEARDDAEILAVL